MIAPILNFLKNGILAYEYQVILINLNFVNLSKNIRVVIMKTWWIRSGKIDLNLQ
nr:hypothetical protein [Clostridioides sp.]